MIKTFLGLVLAFLALSASAQNLKTGVLVVGSGPAAYSAAIQSAHSGVKTILLDAGALDQFQFNTFDRKYKIGVYADFVNRVDSLQKFPLKDSHTLTTSFTAQVFKTWTDTIKNLSVLKNQSVRSLKRSGKSWEVILSDREVRADVIVDATAEKRIAGMAGTNLKKQESMATIYANKLFRTSVGLLANNDEQIQPLVLATLLDPATENIVLASPIGFPNTMISAQAAGAVAAYCVFFKTSTNKVNVRLIQSELLTYKSQLFKFADIVESDSSITAFQHISVTGILKGKYLDRKLYFMPDSTVSTEDLRLPLREYYSRSQIWFLDNKANELTIKGALSLIKFLASRGQELDTEVEKAWTSRFRLKGKFDLERKITRRELVMLLDAYLEPFTVAVDLVGNVKS